MRRHKAGKRREKVSLMSVGQSLLLPNSIRPIRAGAAGSALQVSYSIFILFSFSPSYERVTGKGLGIQDLTTFSFAYRAEKSSGCPAEPGIFGLIGSGPGISASYSFSLDLSSAPALQAQPSIVPGLKAAMSNSLHKYEKKWKTLI